MHTQLRSSYNLYKYFSSYLILIPSSIYEFVYRIKINLNSDFFFLLVFVKIIRVYDLFFNKKNKINIQRKCVLSVVANNLKQQGAHRSTNFFLKQIWMGLFEIISLTINSQFSLIFFFLPCSHSHEIIKFMIFSFAIYLH